MNNFRSKLEVLAVQNSGNQQKTKLLLEMSKRLKRLKLITYHLILKVKPWKLEKKRVDLLGEVTKRDDCQVVAEKMAKTFSLCRQEIMIEAPAIKDFMERWPALFDAIQHNTIEVRREVAIRCLIVYLGEKEKDLFKEFSVSNSTS
ncbi:hypothetical protein F7725_009496 [Dissostichus mawsoni]|uniref:Uncharacterized protein n=1 Tax=Dissostichus mawsoni TaxID=36200 RepID=A0A7J5XNS5_DISMA|nr:hypothetical protein F7725_009496 [Dissostichus mawsoni]